MTADAEDVTHRHYNFRVEYVGKVPGQDWMSAVILRLSDELTTEVGDVLLSLSYRGSASNRVRVGIGHVGGGLPDDAGAAPTPAPPYTISGQVTEGGQGLGNTLVTLSGAGNAQVTTDSNGLYSFTVDAVGDYTVTPSKSFYQFTPPTVVLTHLTNSRTGISHAATRQTFTISGQLTDENGTGADNIAVALVNLTNGSNAVVSTSNGGSFSFSNVPAGFEYTVTPDTSIFTFPQRHIEVLSGNVTLVFNGIRRNYTLNGQVTDDRLQPLNGVTVTLTNLANNSTTSINTSNGGNFSFSNVPAGFSYTLTPDNNAIFTFVSQTLNTLSGNLVCDFIGARRSYTLSGQVTDENLQGLDGITLTLTSPNRSPANVDTSNGGNFSFSDVAAGFNYTLTPGNNQVFTFASQNVNGVSSNVTLNIQGMRRSYTISGQVRDNTNQGLAGVTIDLSSGAQTLTDGNGNYAFAGVPAGFGYMISAAKTHYIFNPQTRTIANLQNSEALDFSGVLRKYAINGRVVDGGGQGLFGATVTLSGTETFTTHTDAAGNYSFLATALGNYVITPSFEQDYFVFTPTSQQVNVLTSDQSANFSGVLAPLPNPSTVLEFDGSPKSVDYGPFWPPGDLGHFFWEFWAMPGQNAGATYLLSDGWGGAHALLFGFGHYGSSESGRYRLFGNTFDGVFDLSHITFFGSDQGPAVGEWGHFAVGWDGQNIITYYNGVPSGKAAFAGPRQSPSQQGGSRLLIGGSDHNNLVGRIAQVRGYEGSNPREGDVESSFAPQNVFSVGGSLLSYYFRSAPKMADLSNGFLGEKHVGTPRGTTAGIPFDCGACPPPQFVFDNTAPNFVAGTPPPPVSVATPDPVPAGVRVFDSFGRVNSTYLFGAKGGLGSTEGGSAGQQVWQVGQDSLQQKAFGILNGVVVLLGNDTSLAWVPTGSATGNLDVRVNRRAGLWGSGISTGVGFRVASEQSYFFAYTNGSASDNQTLTVGYYLAGVRTNLATGLNMPAQWTTLRTVTSNSGSISIFADNVLVYSTNNPILATATGAGLYNNTSGLALVNRWDDFGVFDVP